MSKHYVNAEEYRLPLHVELLPEGKYLVTSKSLPGLVAQGDTVAETISIAQDVAKQIIAVIRAHGGPLPKSRSLEKCPSLVLSSHELQKAITKSGETLRQEK